MQIYVIKVRANYPDGWGRSTGIETTVIGRYHTRAQAEARLVSCQQRANADYWVGAPWIDVETVE